MWSVSPQPRGLGRGAAARRRGTASPAEARAHLAQPALGPRLVECTGPAGRVEGRSAHRISGGPDDLKFHSSVTLSAAAEPEALALRGAPAEHFGGASDALTAEMLRPP